MRVIKGLFARSVLAALPLYAGQANAAKVNPLEILGKQPLGFERNRGQAREDVDYVATTGTGNVYVRATGAILLLSRRDPLVGIGLRIDFAGARALAKGQPENLIPGVTSSYFSGRDRSKWITGLPKYAKLRYQEVWPGIDVVYYGNGSRLEYDFVIAPGANPAAIQLRFSGMDSIQLAPNGDLELRTAAGLLYQRAPEIYQTIGGLKRKVNGHYVLSGSEAHFQIANYDRTKSLVIDPVLVYSKSSLSDMGGTFQANAIAVDPSGNAYITGIANASQPSVNGPIIFRTFLMALDNAGNAVRTQIFGGTDGNTFGNALAMDSSLNLYIAGSTGATDTDVVGWGFQPAYGGGTDAWFAKLARQSDGSYFPTYLTCIGGSGFDSASAVAFDSTGKAYVVGTTFSSNFPAKPAASFRATGSTAFLAKIDPSVQTGSGSLVYSTFIGGTGTDNGTGVAVDGSFNAYVAGTTTSTTLSGGFQPASSTGFAASKQNTNLDGFVVKLNASGTAATNLTFFSNGPINGMALGSDNSVYITGNTNGGIPVNSALAGYQVGAQGGQDAFLAKFDPTLSTLAYSSYIGGTADDSGNSVAVDQNGNAVVVGQTSSPNFPSTTTALQATGSDVLPDAFISRINTANSGAASLSFSGTLGGDAIDRARSVVVDAQGNAYIAGDTASTNFPPATGQANSQRAFVAKISTIGPPPQAVPAAITTPANGSTLGGSTVNFQWSTGTGMSSQYWLRVGTTGAGSYDIFAAAYNGTSATVSGLPTNGSTIYVRLYSQNAATGVWASNDYTYTANGSGGGASFAAAAITTPVNGSILGGSTVNFQWSAGTGTASQYWLRVGTTGVGSYDIFAALYNGTSATVSGLPTNGSTIYVRLYSQNAATGVWISNDYTYTANGSGGGASFAAAAITTPANGSTLGGSTVNFQWSAGTGTASQYWLRVGTTGVGSYDISGALYNGSTSATISGLPTNGSSIYVRLYSQNAATGVWVSNDYTYKANGSGGGASFAAAAITTPVNGSTLGGSTVNFQWSAGTGTSSQYWLRVGTTGAGSYDISGALYNGTSATVSGLPTNGSTIYVRLYSQNAATGVWVSNDYTYTANGSGGGASFAAAAITTPANGSTLGGSTVNFQWSAGTGTSSQYWLRVGTTGAGSYDISGALYNGTSATVSGLPTNGSTIYVRLYSQNAATGVWASNDYTYTAH